MIRIYACAACARATNSSGPWRSAVTTWRPRARSPKATDELGLSSQLILNANPITADRAFRVPDTSAAAPDFSKPVVRPRKGLFHLAGEVLRHGGPGYL